MTEHCEDAGKGLHRPPLTGRVAQLGVAWILGSVLTLALIGTVTGMGLFDHSAMSGSVVAPAADRIVLTADAPPPALWSNRWLGHHPYRAIAFDGLSHFATGFVLSVPNVPQRSILRRWGPYVSTRIVRWRHDMSVVGHEALFARVSL